MIVQYKLYTDIVRSRYISSCLGFSLRVFSRSRVPWSRVRPRPGVSVTRTVPLITSVYGDGSQTSSAQTSLAETEWKVAAVNTDDMCAFIARVIAPPVFCLQPQSGQSQKDP